MVLISSNISFETKIVPITACSASILFGSSLKLFLTKFKFLLITNKLYSKKELKTMTKINWGKNCINY